MVGVGTFSDLTLADQMRRQGSSLGFGLIGWRLAGRGAKTHFKFSGLDFL